MKSGLLVVTFLLFAVTTLAQTNPPMARTVSGQMLTSKDTPAVHLKFDKSFQYIGGQSFVLYDVANAEQHFFVDADKDGRIKRLFWIQFEGYLPTNTHSYNYKSPTIVSIGGLNFFADAAARSLKGNPGGQIRTGLGRARSWPQKDSRCWVRNFFRSAWSIW